MKKDNDLVTVRDMKRVNKKIKEKFLNVLIKNFDIRELEWINLAWGETEIFNLFKKAFRIKSS
jgi:hypothetical protein